MDFEKNIDRLEEIIKKMEDGKLSLNEGLKLFEEGIRLSRVCHAELNEAEQKVKLLLKIGESGNPITQDFELSEN